MNDKPEKDKQKQIDDMKKHEEDTQKRIDDMKKAQIKNVQQQLQAATIELINTMGQKVQIENILAEQKKKQHQLEGMLQALTIMTQ